MQSQKFKSKEGIKYYINIPQEIFNLRGDALAVNFLIESDISPTKIKQVNFVLGCTDTLMACSSIAPGEVLSMLQKEGLKKLHFDLFNHDKVFAKEIKRQIMHTTTEGLMSEVISKEHLISSALKDGLDNEFAFTPSEKGDSFKYRVNSDFVSMYRDYVRQEILQFILLNSDESITDVMLSEELWIPGNISDEILNELKHSPYLQYFKGQAKYTVSKEGELFLQELKSAPPSPYLDFTIFPETPIPQIKNYCFVLMPFKEPHNSIDLPPEK